MKQTGAALKWHGGKHNLARRLVELMPPDGHYVEPFAGGLSVLLAKDAEGISEVVNDINGDLTNFWRVLQDTDSFKRFRRIVEAVPFSEWEWTNAAASLDAADPVERAVAFFVRCRQSLAGRMDTFAPLTRKRTRRGMNEQASAWISAVDGLPAVHARLGRVVILKRPALEVIRSQDTVKTLFYLAPPYLPETRTSVGQYAHEMDTAAHKELLDVLHCEGDVVRLSISVL
jgi:DNA adenine methylase